jgi:hypothetical protein
MKQLIRETLREYLIELDEGETFLYHGTSDIHLTSILKNGFRKNSHWGYLRIAKYYAEVASEDDGGRPILIRIPISKFDDSLFRVDMNSVMEPITYTLGQTEEELWEQWEESEQTWEDCLEIFESVIYNGRLTVKKKNIVRLP